MKWRAAGEPAGKGRRHMVYAGVDIGGTKCAVVLGRARDGQVEILHKEKFPTRAADPSGMLEELRDSLARQIAAAGLRPEELGGIGISCGGPLNSRTGRILSPPNLPLWADVPAADYFEEAFRVPARLQNDANACAMAEWKFGAGKGAENMVFLTFGTGFGAGLILDSRLYCGACDMAGEVGHVRIAEDGPLGYGKRGSLEGFCSGGGIARLGRARMEEELAAGRRPALFDACGGDPERVTAKLIAELADGGDPLCRAIYRLSGEKLGRGLSLLADILNPDVIVIGSIFARSQHLLWEACDEVMRRECLALTYQSCRVLPSALGDAVGDVAALSIVME